MTRQGEGVGMSVEYPEIEPFAHGMLDVDDGHQIYWEMCGNPQGKPALVVHGGPGSGCTPWYRTLFDPDAYRVVLFDQRNCGRSIPHASLPGVDLSANTTEYLIEDMERLRRHLNNERWLLFGGSWGSTLALAYAERYPERVAEIVLFGVTTGRHAEMDWLFRGGVSIFFPEQWDRLRAALPASERGADVVAAYHRLLTNPDANVCQSAANAWCLWESATLDWPPSDELSGRFADPAFALAFARIVTHYISHNAWLEDGSLLRDAGALANIPGVLINGRFDFQAPIANAWELRRVWPRAVLVIVDHAGHAANASGVSSEIVRALDRFARTT